MWLCKVKRASSRYKPPPRDGNSKHLTTKSPPHAVTPRNSKHLTTKPPPHAVTPSHGLPPVLPLINNSNVHYPRLSKQHNQIATLVKSFLLNAQGINPSVRAHNWKIPFIERWIAEQSHHIPFFVLTETHLNNSHFDAEMKISNFASIRADRSGRSKGGVAIFLHDSLTADAKDTFSNGYYESTSVHNKVKLCTSGKRTAEGVFKVQVHFHYCICNTF